MSLRLLALALALAGCAGGPLGPEELELVRVTEQADDALPLTCRVEARLSLPPGDWELGLPLPVDDDRQRVESLLVQVGPAAESEQSGEPGRRLLRVTGRGPLEVRWRARVVPLSAAEVALPAAAAAVEPLEPLEAWVAALGAAGLEARLRRGLVPGEEGSAQSHAWVEVRAEGAWLPVDSAGGASLEPPRVALSAEVAEALRDGEPVALDVTYQLRVE